MGGGARRGEGPVSGGWAALCERLHRREVGTSLALFRIGLGLALLAIVQPILATGVHALVLLAPAEGGYKPLAANWLLDLLGGATCVGVERLLVAAMLAGGALVLGLGGRLTALVTLQLGVALYRLNPEVAGGALKLWIDGAWLAVLANTTATLACDCRLRTGRWWSERTVAAWPRYLAVHQLVVVYTMTGVQKLAGVAWTPWGDFAAVYQVLLQPSWQRIDMAFIAPLYPLLQGLTVLTLVFEIGAPVWLLAAWYRDTRERPGRLRAACNRVDLRRVWALIGVGLHLGIELCLEVGSFGLVTLSFYACLWHPGAWARCATHAKARARAVSARCSSLVDSGRATRARSRRRDDDRDAGDRPGQTA